MTNEVTVLTGPKVILMGPGGTGKTTALGTLADWCEANGKTMFVLGLDSGIEALFGYWTDGTLGPVRPIPKCLHWRTLMTRPLGLQQLMKAAEQVGNMSYEMVTKLQDNQRGGENNAFWKILAACAKPVSDRDGTEFESLDSWGMDKVFVIDGLSELSNAAMKMQIGNKPTAAPPDYGVAQNNLLNFLRLCAQGTKCTFVLIAHVEREKNEITGNINITISTVGKAICGIIPTMFSDVIYTQREGDKFYWDTAAYGVDSKTRSLGYRSKLPPTFASIMDQWVKRGGK